MGIWPSYGYDDGAEERTPAEVRADHARLGGGVACDCLTCDPDDYDPVPG